MAVSGSTHGFRTVPRRACARPSTVDASSHTDAARRFSQLGGTHAFKGRKCRNRAQILQECKRFYRNHVPFCSKRDPGTSVQLGREPGRLQGPRSSPSLWARLARLLGYAIKAASRARAPAFDSTHIRIDPYNPAILWRGRAYSSWHPFKKIRTDSF